MSVKQPRTAYSHSENPYLELNEATRILEMCEYCLADKGEWYYVNHDRFGTIFATANGMTRYHWFELCLMELFPILFAAERKNGALYVKRIQLEDLVFFDVVQTIYINGDLIDKLYDEFILIKAEIKKVIFSET